MLSSLKKEHVCCTSMIDKLVKIKYDHIAIIGSNKSTLENLEKENISLKKNVKELNDKLDTSRASTLHVHSKSYNSFTHNKNHSKRYHNNSCTYNRGHDKHYMHFNNTNLKLFVLTAWSMYILVPIVILKITFHSTLIWCELLNMLLTPSDLRKCGCLRTHSKFVK